MENTFDKLYDEFMEPYGPQKTSMTLIQRVMDNMPYIEPGSQEAEDFMFQVLGEPNEIEYFEKDGLYYQRNIWHAEYGRIMCNIPYDSPPEGMYDLEEELKQAIDAEDYERAAELRDKINKQKKDK